MNSILLMILLGVNWHQEMKTLFQYYTFDIKISNNIFFGAILVELRYVFMNAICSLWYSSEDLQMVCKDFNDLWHTLCLTCCC